MGTCWDEGKEGGGGVQCKVADVLLIVTKKYNSQLTLRMYRNKHFEKHMEIKPF
jgi:hypothetical protein